MMEQEPYPTETLLKSPHLIALAALSSEQVEILAALPDVNVRRKLIAHPGVPIERVRCLLQDRDLGCVGAAARREDLPEDLQEEVLREETRHRIFLAANPCITPRIQEVLSGDTSDVVETLAANPSLVPEVQRKIFKSRSVWNLTQNPALIPEIQDEFMRREGYHMDVAWIPTLRSEYVAKLVESTNVAVLENLAKNTSLSISFQEKLLKLGDQSVQSSLAANEGISPEVAIALSFATEPLTRFYLSGNPSAQPSSKMEASFLNSFHRPWMRENPLVTPEVTDLLDGWSGSLDDLIEAVALTLR